MSDEIPPVSVMGTCNRRKATSNKENRNPVVSPSQFPPEESRHYIYQELAALPVKTPNFYRFSAVRASRLLLRRR
jgi:hypothetical protein